MPAHIFTIAGLDYICSINPRGRRKYGSILELLASGTGEACTVGLADGTRADDPGLRSCMKYTSVFRFLYPNREELEDRVRGEIQKIIPLAHWSSTSIKYSVLEYGVGGFFKAHRDIQKGTRHCGTLLIFPPAVGVFTHTGGELVISDKGTGERSDKGADERSDKGTGERSDKTISLASSQVTEWTFLAFTLDVLHECLPVLSGRRVVIKAEIYSDKPVLFERPISPPITD